MSLTRARLFDLARAPLLLAPLALPLIAPAAHWPPALAYVTTEARWLVLWGVFCAVLALLTAETRFDLDRRALPAGTRGLAWWLGLLALGLALLWLVIPPERLAAVKFSGDEPKYLRLADSLHHDLDVDLAADSGPPPDLRTLARNVRGLAQATGAALHDLWRDPFPDVASEGANLGNWTVRGRHGGLYHLQSPGLPALLLPARWLQPTLDPGRPNSLALLTLAVVFALMLVSSARLATELSGSALAGTLAALAVATQAPLLVGGFHFYPEAIAAAVVPWLALQLRSTERCTYLGVLSFGLVAGSLPWLHPKFCLLALAALALRAWHVRGARGRLGALLLAAALPVAALLLFDHHVTGLLRPDALYVRAPSAVYAGLATAVSLRTLLGLGVAFWGARDGLFVMAPVALAAVLALPWAYRRQPRATAEGLILVISLWLAVAVHQGGAPGPPGRLLAPILPLTAPLLALGLVALGRRRSYRFVVGLALTVGLSISWAQIASWRRTVDPYEGVFASAAVDFARDLPDSPRLPGERPTGAEPGREGARLLLLSLALGAWTVVFSRQGAPRPAWPSLRACHLAAWSTLALLAALLRALR